MEGVSRGGVSGGVLVEGCKWRGVSGRVCECSRGRMWRGIEEGV